MTAWRCPQRAAGVLVLLGLHTLANGQASAPATVQVAPPDACRLEVSKFEQVIGFLRQNQGNQAAADIKERLLPAKLESEILFKDGYCGLAKYLRDKKLVR
jgi:hypothetical protein